MSPEKRALRRPLERPTLFAVVVLASSFGGITVERPPETEPDVATFASTTSGLAKGKDAGLGSVVAVESDAEGPVEAPLLGTLAHTHTNEHLPLTASEPTGARFSAFLADHVTDSSHAIDPRLIALLRTLAARHPGARFEIVSGYRSEKLNESRRKKGRHVASHSQHSLGQAVDFRVVPRGEIRGLDPRGLEKEIRAAGWEGGVGVYTLASDWFVHADVGKNRRWSG